jgi:hypothetical protein
LKIPFVKRSTGAQKIVFAPVSAEEDVSLNAKLPGPAEAGA